MNGTSFKEIMIPDITPICKYTQYNVGRKRSGPFQIIVGEQRRKLKNEIIQVEMIYEAYIPNFTYVHTHTIN